MLCALASYAVAINGDMHPIVQDDPVAPIDPAVVPEPVAACTKEQIEDPVLKGKVKMCSTIGQCYNLEEKNYKNDRCGPTESCAWW